MGMTDAENSNRGSSKSSGSSTSRSSVGGGKASNPSTKTGNSRSSSAKSGSKSSVGGGKSSNPSTKTRSASGRSGDSSFRSSVGGGKSSNPSTKTRSASIGSGRSTASASVGGGKASNPATKTGAASRSASVDTGPASRAVDSVSKALSSFGDSISKAFGGLGSRVVDAAIASATPKTSFGSLKGPAKTAAEAMADEASKFGVTLGAHQISGMLGRLSVESDLDPTAKRIGDNKKYKGELADSIGIAQWNGPRQQALKAFAKENKADFNDLATQARFVVHEMATSEKRAWNAVKAATNEKQAAIGMMHYERPDGYSVTNPVGGMHWEKTVERTKQFSRSLRTASLSDEQSTPSVLGTALAMANPKSSRVNDGVSTASAYTDPYVTTSSSKKNAGAAAIDSVTSTPDAETTKQKDRLGLGKLSKSIEEKDYKTTVTTIAKAVRDPLGFVLDSIEDGINQNGGFGANLAGKKGSYASRVSMGGDHGGGGNNKQDSLFVIPPVETAAIPAEKPTAVAAVTPTPMTRKPFGWSTLLVGDQPKFIV